MIRDTMWTYVVCTLICFGGVSSLKDVRLDVYPSPVIKGGTAALVCYRDMQDHELYSVKWYRGNHEFYRYTPLEDPKTRVFSLPGIFVDMNNSNGTQVLLKRLDLSLAGNFSCEVTAESPYFSTLIAIKYIDVISSPENPPMLEADKERYSPGETLRANCTSSPARPAANLTIFINDEPIRSSETSLHPYENGLVWASVSAEVPISQELFPGGRLRVSCLANIYDVYNHTTKLDFFTPEVDPRPERITLTGGGSSKTKFQNWLLLLFLLFLPMLTATQESVFFYPDYVENSPDYLDPADHDNLRMSLVGG